MENHTEEELAFDASFRELYLKCPGLIAEKVTNTNAVKISGVAYLNYSWYRMILYCPNYPQLNDFALHVNLDTLYKPIDRKSFQLDANSTVVDLIKQIPSVINRITSQQEKCDNAIHDSNIYSEIVKVIAPQDYKTEVNQDYTRVRFTNFQQYKQHYLELELPSLRLLDHSLPNSVPWQELFDKYAHQLSAAVALFQRYLLELQPFYDCFEDIDELCHVVEPCLPTTKHNWRIFLLCERVYLKLTLADVFSPHSTMSLNIIGPTNLTERFRHMLSEGMRTWDTELDIHKNLLRIFDLCFFPMPPEKEIGSETEEEEVYCNICYSYRLERDEAPIVSCDNQQCSVVFHAACLKRWFNTLADGKTFLDVSFGACPFCKSKLSTSFAMLLET